ncbi:non-ribosomal peptide synthetase, partial [Pseudoalteromonas phenolica]
VDRKQLAGLFAEVAHNDTYQKPETALEKQLADIWQPLLKREKISRMDDFFAIGGDSLAATQLLQTLQRQHLIPMSVSLTTLFNAPTLAQFANRIENAWQDLGGNNINQETLFEEGTI